MTDEEKAEEYADWFWGASSSERRAIKQAYLAGLEAGKGMTEADLATVAYMQGAERYQPKWHDLRKNPNDLPKGYRAVLNQAGMITTYDPDRGFLDLEGIGVIAWCEIPTFEE